jgi:hypothetical protein
MCSECYQNPCHPQCPNAPDPPAVYFCFSCGDSIVDGQDYFEVADETYCEDCVFHRTAEYEEC